MHPISIDVVPLETGNFSGFWGNVGFDANLDIVFPSARPEAATFEEGVVIEIAVTAHPDVIGVGGGGGKVEVGIEAEAFSRCGSIVAEGNFDAIGVEQAHH